MPLRPHEARAPDPRDAAPMAGPRPGAMARAAPPSPAPLHWPSRIVGHASQPRFYTWAARKRYVFPLPPASARAQFVRRRARRGRSGVHRLHAHIRAQCRWWVGGTRSPWSCGRGMPRVENFLDANPARDRRSNTRPPSARCGANTARPRCNNTTAAGKAPPSRSHATATQAPKPTQEAGRHRRGEQGDAERRLAEMRGRSARERRARVPIVP